MRAWVAQYVAATPSLDYNIDRYPLTFPHS